MRYHEVEPITREQASNALASADPAQICNALVSIAYHEDDWRWAQDQFLSFLGHANPEISGLAATCLGHVARIHGTLDAEKVLAALRGRLNDPEIGGRVSDALDDIELFLR